MVNPADYIILSVRGSSDYAKGHVPGAFNIEYKEVADRVSELDKNKKIMVYCYTSNTGSIATTGLNLMGYTAMNMKYGMMGYNNDTTTGGKAVETAVNGYLGTADIEITANTATSTYSYPVLNTGKSSAEEIAKARYSSYIAEQKLKFNFTITAQDVKLLVDGKNSSSSSVTLSDGTVINPADYQIVSVRAAQAYAIGHIPTAINIPYKEIAKTENLQKLDPDKTIIVYCYTGHTGGISASILNLLGYKARNLKYGMEGYTTDNTTVKGEQSSYTRFSGSLNYSLEN
jgi:rhodanese-related sulfurtransferase